MLPPAITHSLRKNNVMETPKSSDSPGFSAGRACSSGSDQCQGAAINIGDMERAISVGAGGFVLLYGLSKLSLSSLVALVAGGALLYRNGVSGHCSDIKRLERISTNDEEGLVGKRANKPRLQPGVTDVSLAATGESDPKSSRSSR